MYLFLLFASCEKGSYQPAPASAEDQFRTQMRSAFEQTYPVTDLPVDWSEAIVYRRADSSRVAMVRLRGYLGEFGYNVRAKQYKGKLRAAYMACSPWLIVTVDRGTTKAHAIVSSAIPQVEYLADTHYPLRYISVLNTQKFSGDIVVFDVRRKPLYRICYTDGRIDDQREPMTIGIVHKVFTKNSEEDPYMLDDVVVIGHRPNQPSDDDFCLHNPELCGIGEIGPITGTDESDGPDQPPIPDGQDDNDQGQGSGGGGQGISGSNPNVPADKNIRNALTQTGWSPLDDAGKYVLDRLPANLSPILNHFRVTITLTKGLPRIMEGNMTSNSLDLNIDQNWITRNNMNMYQIADCLLHEIGHLVLERYGFQFADQGYNNLNDTQHYYMINPPSSVSRDGFAMEDLYRAVFPGESEEFYKYIIYSGVDIQYFNGVTYKDVQKATDVLKNKKN